MGKKPIPERLVSCGVFVTRGEPIDSFLLMKHKKRWDLPKGHVDPGETELECAYRELEEETGIASSDIVLDQSFRYASDYVVRYKKYNRQPIPKTLVIFLGRLVRDVDIVVTEHLGFKWQPWCPPHQIQEQAIDPLLRAVEEHFARS